MLAEEMSSSTTSGSQDASAFDRQLSSTFARAREAQGSLGVIFVEVDRLDALGDRLGRQARGLILKVVERTLNKAVGSAAVVYRCGGDRFGLILTAASRIDAANTAERLRKTIECQKIIARRTAASGEAVQVTVSLGVAALEPEIADRLGEPAQLRQLAEGALEAAHRAGRNCVRIFSPKPKRPAAA